MSKIKQLLQYAFRRHVEENFLKPCPFCGEQPNCFQVCEFGVDCLMPGEHLRHECYTVEMARAWQDEEAEQSEQFT